MEANDNVAPAAGWGGLTVPRRLVLRPPQGSLSLGEVPARLHHRLTWYGGRDLRVLSVESSDPATFLATIVDADDRPVGYARIDRDTGVTHLSEAAAVASAA